MERVVDGNQDNSWKEGKSEGFNLRGQRVELIVKFTLSVYSPLFVSSAGWGASIQSAWPGVYEFGIEDPRLLTVKQEGPSLSILIIPGPTPKDVTERYARATALSLLPPRWAFGHFRWRDDIYNHPAFFDGTPYNGPYNSMVVEDILMLEALGIPTTLYWIDRPFGKGDFGYDNIGWDESRVPKAKEMISWLKSKGINFMLWVCPWASGDKMLSEAAENDYIVDGQALMPPLSAKLIDFTIPAAADWWQGYLKERIADGVAGFKLDRADEKVPDGLFYEGMYRDGTDFREGRNLYPVWYAKAAHDAFVEAGVKEFIVMPRAAWQGSQKYSTPWGGDSGLSEWGLRSAIIGAQRSAALNFPIWGSDTCGYGGAIDREVCARWLAFSAFTPIMEVGPTGNYAFWSMPKEGEKPVIDEKGYHYETTYDSELLAIYRLYADIHHRLIDYSYSQAKAAHETGQMFIRPMIFMHPDKPEYLDFYEQYYYGPDVIVHPVWRKSQTSATVILPEGEWIDAWTGLSVSSGAISVQTPLYRMPIYIRKGGTADLGDLAALWETAQSVTAIKPDLAVLAETLK